MQRSKRLQPLPHLPALHSRTHNQPAATAGTAQLQADYNDEAQQLLARLLLRLRPARQQHSSCSQCRCQTRDHSPSGTLYRNNGSTRTSIQSTCVVLRVTANIPPQPTVLRFASCMPAPAPASAPQTAGQQVPLLLLAWDMQLQAAAGSYMPCSCCCTSPMLHARAPSALLAHAGSCGVHICMPHNERGTVPVYKMYRWGLKTPGL